LKGNCIEKDCRPPSFAFANDCVRWAPKLEAAQHSTDKGREDCIAKLQADYQAKQDEIKEHYRRLGEEATPVQVKLRKGDIRVTHFGLAWAPFWRVAV